jgi:preprotein translocase subunit SecG
LEIVLYAIFFLSCVVLVGSVLLQPGKTDAGALFTSNISSSAFAPRGTATVLSKITIGAATAFMLSALMLAMPALTGEVSVLDSAPEEVVEEVAAPAEPSTEASPAVTPNAETAAPSPDASNSATPEAK